MMNCYRYIVRVTFSIKGRYETYLIPGETQIPGGRGKGVKGGHQELHLELSKVNFLLAFPDERLGKEFTSSVGGPY